MSSLNVWSKYFNKHYTCFKQTQNQPSNIYIFLLYYAYGYSASPWKNKTKIYNWTSGQQGHSMSVAFDLRSFEN